MLRTASRRSSRDARSSSHPQTPTSRHPRMNCSLNQKPRTRTRLCGYRWRHWRTICRSATSRRATRTRTASACPIPGESNRWNVRGRMSSLSSRRPTPSPMRGTSDKMCTWSTPMYLNRWGTSVAETQRCSDTLRSCCSLRGFSRHPGAAGGRSFYDGLTLLRHTRDGMAGPVLVGFPYTGFGFREKPSWCQ